MLRGFCNFQNVFIFISLLVSRTSADLRFNNLRDKMDLELLKLMSNQNTVSSALMMRFPLCKIASVADGEALEELRIVLGVNNIDDFNTCYSSISKSIQEWAVADLTYVNAIYVNYTDDIDPAFIVDSESKFGVRVAKVGFHYPKAAVQFINRIIGTATFRRIVDVMDVDDIDKNTTMVIVNAIYFKANWEFPFNIKKTKGYNFHHSNGKVSRVMMMKKFSTYYYIDAGEFQAIQIKLSGESTSMTFILPAQTSSLPSLISKAHSDPDYFRPFLSRMAPETRLVMIPRFDIKTYVDWTGFLKQMGLYGIFDCTVPNLSAILREELYDKPYCLNKAKSKLFFQLDEMGVHRTIYSLREERGTFMDQGPDVEKGEYKDFVLDRPFLFTVNIDFHSENRQVLMMGAFYGPEK
ncbi:serine protease inhibitor 3/4-like [Anticarsia gemmatalis]|uniref:serine protease inhibitor 3/4-like n=1 Tax=Anticarsia gemmatalis TaxID=129554 RepID=UPI003F75CA57